MTTAVQRIETEGMANAAALYAAARPMYAPRIYVPPVEWIERHFVITSDSGAALPGPYRFDHVPWWREVVEVLGDQDTERVVVAKSSQVGYTELLLAWLAWCMAQDPSSILLIQPTVEMAEEFSKGRLEPAFRDVEPLRGLIRGKTRGMARSSDDTLRRKAFPGGFLAMGGANSPAGLASRPVRRVVGDEFDRWPFSAGDEGSPLELARRRAITFWNRKIVAGGTPVAEGASPTWALWEQSDQRRWLVACPHCGERQAFRWRDDDGAYHFVFDRDERGEVVLDSVEYRCAHCACLIEERHKASMVAGGEWVPEHEGRRIRGYHIWAAYSPFMSWGEICDDFLKAHGVENDLKTFVNTILGLPFAPAAEKLDPTKLLARAESFGEPLVPPREVGVLTAGVDVQGDRLEYVLSGWGEDERLAVLHYGIVEGDPGQDATWDALEAELGGTWDGLRVSAVAVDTGYRPETVWRWAARARAAYRIFPVKGQDGRGRLLMQKPAAVTRKRQRRPWLVGVDSAKDSLAARLRSVPDGPQGVRFSETLPPEYFDHLTAERLVPKYVGGRPTRKWELIPGRRNEGLDCTIYSLAALHGLGAPTLRSLGAKAAARHPQIQAADDQSSAPERHTDAVIAARKAPRKRRGWVNGWKK